MVSQPTLLGSSLGFRFSFGCGGELVVCEGVGWFACTYKEVCGVPPGRLACLGHPSAWLQAGSVSVPWCVSRWGVQRSLPPTCVGVHRVPPHPFPLTSSPPPSSAEPPARVRARWKLPATRDRHT